MIEKSTIEKVLGIFFENPSREFHLRQLAREMKMSLPTIMATTDSLCKDKFILKTKGTVLTIVRANRENTQFVRLKRVHNIAHIYESGLVDALFASFNYPKAIILFGSYARGEDTENSDVDLAIFTSRKSSIDVSSYERFLKKTISLHLVDEKTISKEFKSSLHNGIVLEGTW